MTSSETKTGFSNLKKLAENVDNRLLSLNAQVSVGLGQNFLTNEPAEIAEEFLEEVKEMHSEVKNLLQTVCDKVQNMETFLSGIEHMVNEIEESVLKAENHASKFGFVAQPRQPLGEAYETFVRNKMSDERDEPEVAPDVVTDTSPNLLTIGLTKATLKQLGYQFKEDVQAVNQEQSDVAACHLKENLNDTDICQDFEETDSFDDDATAPVSILKHAKPKDETSVIEISPGLFVRRPSSRITKKVVENFEKRADEKKPVPNPDDSPVMPVLKTFNWAAYKSQVLTNTNNTESVTATKDQPKIQPHSGDNSPSFPVLKTFNWSGSVQHSKCDNTDKRLHLTDSPPKPLLNWQSNQLSAKRDDLHEPPRERRLSETPPMPELKTVDVKKLLREAANAIKAPDAAHRYDRWNEKENEQQ